MAYLLPKETRSPVSSEEEGQAVKFHLEAHIQSTESVQHASLWVRNPTSPIVGSGENYTYHDLHVWEATNSADTFSCSWMQSAAVGLCVIPQCLFRLRKTGHLVLRAVPPPWTPIGLTRNLPCLTHAWAALAHTLYCWPLTSAALADWDKKYPRKRKKYFLFSLSTAHLVHARVLLYMGRSNRKSLQSKRGRNTTVQSWAWQIHDIALTNLTECLGALQAFTTAWGLDGRCISIQQPRGWATAPETALWTSSSPSWSAEQKRAGKGLVKRNK